MEILFFWILLSLAPAMIASNKGRSGPRWFFLGLLISPLIASIIALVVSEKDAEKRAIQSGKMKKCPRCAEPIRAEAKVCRYCGHEFNIAAETSFREPEQVGDNQWKCKCGDVVSEKETHCDACGRSREAII